MNARRRLRALVVVAAVAAACTSSPPHEPRSWPAATLATVSSATPEHVFGPDSGDTSNCGDVLTSMAVGSDGTIYVTEDTCQLTAGFGEPGRHHRTSRRPPHLLHALHPDGTVTQLPAYADPHDPAPVLLLTSVDGTVIGYGGKGQLVALRGTRWQSMSAAHPLGSPGHSGDGGALDHAVVDDVRAAAVDAAGNLYVAEPFAVRRVSRSGVISTIAGTDRADPPHGWYWGGRGSAGQDFPQQPIPTRPAVATRTPMPFISAMTVTADGTVWLINLGGVYRIRQGIFDKLLALPSAPRTLAQAASQVGAGRYGLAAIPGTDRLLVYDEAKHATYEINTDARTTRVLTDARSSGGDASLAVPIQVTSGGRVLVSLGGYGLVALKL